MYIISYFANFMCFFTDTANKLDYTRKTRSCIYAELFDLEQHRYDDKSNSVYSIQQISVLQISAEEQNCEMVKTSRRVETMGAVIACHLPGCSGQLYLSDWRKHKVCC